jgi:hypothetical protein
MLNININWIHWKYWRENNLKTQSKEETLLVKAGCLLIITRTHQCRANIFANIFGKSLTAQNKLDVGKSKHSLSCDQTNLVQDTI